MRKRYKLEEEVELYYSEGYKHKRLLWELIINARRMIHSVYIFKHFDEYSRQLNSDRQEDKLEVYWNASYHEKLIDYIKIVVAFETLNKALLIREGYLVHKIGSFNNNLKRRQGEGKPVKLEDFYAGNYTVVDPTRRQAHLNGLTSHMATINFSQTLNDHYQQILHQDLTLVYHLKEINRKRNRLHLYSDFKGAFSVYDHLKKWKTLRDLCFATIDKEAEKIEEELKNCQDVVS